MYENGVIYKGNWNNNLKEGKGKYTFNNKNKIFNGNWENEHFIYGEINYSNWDKHKGNIFENKRNGFGLMKYKIMIYMKKLF